MINYYKQELAKGCYIASYGRWEASEGNIYSPGGIGGISFMSKEGRVLCEMHPQDLNRLLNDLDLHPLVWGNRSTGQGGGTEFRLKDWHELEVSAITNLKN